MPQLSLAESDLETPGPTVTKPKPDLDLNDEELLPCCATDLIQDMHDSIHNLQHVLFSLQVYSMEHVGREFIADVGDWKIVQQSL